MRAVRVVDALLEILPLPTGSAIDDTAAEPARTLPGKLYLWPRRGAAQQLEEANGRWGEADLRLRALYTLAAKGEARVQRRDRPTSIALDDVAEQLFDVVATNRRNPLWWDLYVEAVVYDAVRSFDVRGIAFDLVVRLNLPQPPASGSSSA